MAFNNLTNPHINPYQFIGSLNDDDLDDVKLNDDDKKETKYKWTTPPKVDDKLFCSICHQIMRDPVKLNNVSQHTYCRMCIENWFKINKTNPLTGLKVSKHYRLTKNHEIEKEIKELFDEANNIKSIVNYFDVPFSLTGYTSKPQIAEVAQTYYDDNLKHLEDEYNWTPWAKEKLMYLCCKWIPEKQDDETDQEHSLRILDDLRKDTVSYVHERIDDAEREIQQHPNDAAANQLIIEEVQQDVGFIKQMVNAIIWFFQTLWSAVTWPFRKIGECFCWLFGWD